VRSLIPRATSTPGCERHLYALPAWQQAGRRHSERRRPATECRVMHNYYGGAAALETNYN